MFRLFASFFAICLPALALAQTPTITITPVAGVDTQTIFNQTECAEGLSTRTKHYTVNVNFGSGVVPGAGSTLTLKIGDTCIDNNINCKIILSGEALTQSAQDFDAEFTTQDVVDATGETECEGPDNGIDKQLTLFAVVDVGGVKTEGKTDDNEDIFLDTIIPSEPLNPKASGGEGVLNTSWETNPENENAVFKLEQEAGFEVQCKLTSAAEFSECGTTAAGDFNLIIDELNGVVLENGTSLDFQVIAIDTAGNKSEPSLIATGTPQDVLDFGENFNGAEQGGCTVGHGEGQLLWVTFLIVVILLLRRHRNNEASI